MMTPEEKAKINELLKQLGSPHTVDDLEAMKKRAARTMAEWCAQDRESLKALPQEVKDMQMLARYSLSSAVVGIMPMVVSVTTLEMTIEAAYNLGKANRPPSNV